MTAPRAHATAPGARQQEAAHGSPSMGGVRLSLPWLRYYQVS